MASRITSGARLCVRASIDKLVCNLVRSRHHNAATATGGGTAVAPGSDRTIPSYQVSENPPIVNTTTPGQKPPRPQVWGSFVPGPAHAFVSIFHSPPPKVLSMTFRQVKKLRRDFFLSYCHLFVLATVPSVGSSRSWPFGTRANIDTDGDIRIVTRNP